MLFALLGGIMSAVTVLIILARCNLKKWLGYPALLDGSVTVLLAVVYMGTFSGITTAITGGIVFSLLVTVLRKYYGYSRFSFRQRKWVEVQGKLPAILNTFKQGGYNVGA